MKLKCSDIAPMRRGVVAAALSALLAGALVGAPPAHAAWTTIFPNYSDGLCAGGRVTQVNVAAVPGNTARGPAGQRWVRLEVYPRGQVLLTASLFCARTDGKVGAWRTVPRTITNPVPWKSYYF